MKNSIKVKVIGGIGNQLFVFIFGLAISEQLKTKLNYVSELLETDPTDVTKLLAYHVLVNELKPFEELKGW